MTFCRSTWCIFGEAGAVGEGWVVGGYVLSGFMNTSRSFSSLGPRMSSGMYVSLRRSSAARYQMMSLMHVVKQLAVLCSDVLCRGR
jgi:adenine deaminase